MRNAFRLRQARRLSGADLVLVDDILTTGATSREISKVLKRDGQAGRILILTVARVPLPRETLGGLERRLPRRRLGGSRGDDSSPSTPHPLEDRHGLVID